MIKICALCGAEATATHHLIFGKHRKLADQDRLVIPICDRCHTFGTVPGRIHDNTAAERLSKMLGQAIYERDFVAMNEATPDEARRAFMLRYGINYL